MSEKVYSSHQINDDVERFARDGYRLDMIKPADSPREAQLSKNDKVLRLVLNRKAREVSANPKSQDGWIIGRAGMMYRDLLPNRLDGKLAASHIRLAKGGPVPDYVHYHKIDFQLIYCLKGSIRLVYEDQGEPFWIGPGDCVLQPPEIRHRVLEAKAGSEVLELSSPAEHETWVEHEMTLPTAQINSDRLFDGQQFVRSIANDATWRSSDNENIDIRDLGIFDATNGRINACIYRTSKPEQMTANRPRPGNIGLGFVVAGKEKIDIDTWPSIILTESNATEILQIEFRDEFLRDEGVKPTRP